MLNLYPQSHRRFSSKISNLFNLSFPYSSMKTAVLVRQTYPRTGADISRRKQNTRRKLFACSAFYQRSAYRT